MLNLPEDITFNPSKRAKRMSLRVDFKSGRFVLTTPVRYSPTAIHSFLSDHHTWIEKHRIKRLPSVAFAPDQRVTLLGEDLCLKHNPLNRGKAVRLENNLYIGGDAEFFAARTEAYLRQYAQEHFQCWADDFTALLGLKRHKITVKDTTTRWGSCSSSGAISLSWRLVLAPQEVARYVVAHEVAHLVQMNHSSRFWAIVEALVGDYRTYRQWLKTHGASLFGAGRSLD